MRRHTLRILLGTTAALLTFPALASPSKRKIDRRLLGTWRSNKEKTTGLWKYTKEMTPAARERFEKIFGKFTLRFSETHIFTEFEGTKHVVPYTVVAQDKTSVVIAWLEKEGTSLQHIHFEENGYYILSGYNVEFYTNVSA